MGLAPGRSAMESNLCSGPPPGATLGPGLRVADVRDRGQPRLSPEPDGPADRERTRREAATSRRRHRPMGGAGVPVGARRAEPGGALAAVGDRAADNGSDDRPNGPRRTRHAYAGLG